MEMETITERVISNGSSSVLSWEGGDGTFFGNGTFGGGTLVLEASIDNGLTWVACKDSGGVDLTLAVNGMISFSIGPCKLRVRMSGSTPVGGVLQTETITVSVEDVVPLGVGKTAVTLTLTSGLFSPARVFVANVSGGLGRVGWLREVFDQIGTSSGLVSHYVMDMPTTTSLRLTTIGPGVGNDTALSATLVGSGGMTTNISSVNLVAGVAAVPNVLISLRPR